MATVYKVLGQSSPSATTDTIVYTVPSSYSSVVSTINICNRAATSATFRVAVRPSAEGSTTDKNWIVYGSTIPASDVIPLTIGATLAAGDKIIVYSSSSTLSFSVFGTEISA